MEKSISNLQIYYLTPSTIIMYKFCFLVLSSEDDTFYRDELL